jgi:hypothetical protein
MRQCTILLWAQRSRLNEPEKNKRVSQLLSVMSKLEKDGKLLVRDKLVGLFMMGQIEKDNPIATKSLKRKFNRVKELYPDEMRRLLPPPQIKRKSPVNTKSARKKE